LGWKARDDDVLRVIGYAERDFLRRECWYRLTAASMIGWKSEGLE